MAADRVPNDVIFIAGYGRSGSTVVDTYLAGALGGIGSGELGLLFDWFAKGRLCGCGEPIPECEVWGPLVVQASEEFSLDAAELARELRSAEFGKSDSADLWHAVWGMVMSQLMADHQIVIDSTKTAGGRRRVELLADSPEDFTLQVVHLRRDLRGVINSVRRGNNLSIEHGVERREALTEWKAVLGWHRANRAARSCRRLDTRYVRLDYETFCRNPEEAISSLGLPLTGTAGSVHTVGGNRVARVGDATSIIPDLAWTTELPRRWKAVGALMQVFAPRA